MKSVAIIHPFTGSAAGVVEKNIPDYHSQPHVSALYNLINEKYNCKIEYFTTKFFKYEIERDKLKWIFYPIKKTINGDHRKWKKQFSSICIKAFEKNCPDLTYINMSAHSSPFSFELSKIILAKNKKYVPMLGGQHYTINSRNIEYYQKAHQIIVHTSLQKQVMEKMDMFKEKEIIVFPLGVDCEMFYPMKINSSNHPKLLYVGRIVEWKQIHIAIEALYSLVNEGFEEASIDIIGPVSSKEYFFRLNDLVKELKIEKNVNFLGHINYAELPKYFASADLFTLPSDKETFGMVMIEAMACGTPVIGIDCPGGPKDVISNGIDGILATPDSFSKEVLSFFKENKQIQMSENARRKVLNKYSRQISNQIILESVRSVLKSQ